MKIFILVYHKKWIMNHISTKKIFSKLYVSLLLFCYSLYTVAQTNIKSGNIRYCDVWNFPASGTSLNNVQILDGTTIQSDPTTTNVSSIKMNTTSTIKMNTGDKITITPGGATNASSCQTVSNYSPTALNDIDNWFFNGNGDIYAKSGVGIDYMSGTNVTANVSEEYVIRGVVFVASTVQNLPITNSGGSVKEMNYIRNKTVEIAISVHNYAGTGTETILGTLKFDFGVPVTNYVDGAWKYTTTICDYDATFSLSKSSCLLALRDPAATLAPFLRNSHGTNCYNDMDRITESGLFVFEWSPSTPYVFNAGQKIFLTIKNVHDKDLATQTMNMRFLNVAAELYLSAKTKF